jgi:aryl-alcohol dehydrogenase-like predicted oxidoreductase
MGRPGVIERLGLGTAALGVPYGAPHAERSAPSRAEAAATIEAALDAGIRLIDTAPAYGSAEALVGEVAGGTDCVIATKLPPGITTRDGVRAAAEASLRALRRDVIDVLQVHNATAALLERGVVPAALAELRREGLIRAAGATTYGEADALAVIACAELEVVQVAFSALDRRPAARVLGAPGMRVMTRSALLRGVLSPRGRELGGPFAPLREAADAFRAATGAAWDELPGAAVAYCLSQPGIATTLIGPRDARELRELLDGAARFAGVEFGHGWERELPAELLDPSRWPALEAA